MQNISWYFRSRYRIDSSPLYLYNQSISLKMSSYIHQQLCLVDFSLPPPLTVEFPPIIYSQVVCVYSCHYRGKFIYYPVFFISQLFLDCCYNLWMFHMQFQVSFQLNFKCVPFSGRWTRIVHTVLFTPISYLLPWHSINTYLTLHIVFGRTSNAFTWLHLHIACRFTRIQYTYRCIDGRHAVICT